MTLLANKLAQIKCPDCRQVKIVDAGVVFMYRYEHNSVTIVYFNCFDCGPQNLAPPRGQREYLQGKDIKTVILKPHPEKVGDDDLPALTNSDPTFTVNDQLDFYLLLHDEEIIPWELERLEGVV